MLPQAATSAAFPFGEAKNGAACGAAQHTKHNTQNNKTAHPGGFLLMTIDERLPTLRVATWGDPYKDA